MTAILISTFIGIVLMVFFGGLLFNDERKSWGITIFTAFLGLMLIGLPIAYLLLKVYK
jgi:hypothetical protein